MSQTSDVGGEFRPQVLDPILDHANQMHVHELDHTTPSTITEGVFSSEGDNSDARVIDATERIAQRLADEVRLVEVERFTLTAPFQWSSDHTERTLQQRKFNSMGVKGPAQIEAREPERIDNVLLIDSRKTVDGREHRLISLEIDEHKHVMWITYPKNRTQDDVLVMIQGGLCEVMEGEIGWQQHQKVSTDLPQAVVATHSTFGVGKHGEKLGPLDLMGHNMKELAAHKKALLEAVFGSYPTVLIGTSEGSVVNNMVASKNQKAGNPLRVVGIVNHASALVTPERILPDMVVGFPLTIAGNMLIELTLKSKPEHIISNINILRRSRPRLRDLPVLGRQALSLLHGTRLETLERLTDAYGQNYITIVGETDTLAQIKMWQEQLHHDGLQLIKDRGHGIAVQAIKSGKAMAKAVKKMDLSNYTDPAVAA